MARKRRRAIPLEGPTTHSYMFQDAPSKPWIAPTEQTFYSDNLSLWKSLSGTQVTESENHPNWKTARKGSFLGDSGGDFTMSKQWTALPEKAYAQSIDTGFVTWAPDFRDRNRWSGPITPFVPGGFSFPPFARSSESELAALGTTAIARCAPTNSLASLAVSLLELYREGIPAMLGSPLWERRARNARDVYKTAGDEYLKGQFGWKPLVGDIADVASVIVNFDRLLKQARKDSGRMVRRRYSFPPIRTISETVLSSTAVPQKWGGHDNGSFYRPGYKTGKTIRVRETSINRWFSGAFTYHLPDYGNGLVEQVKEADRFLGLSLDPEVVWNVAPWSWAVDWFSNVGDVVHNVNSMTKYGLVLRYGYIMEHSIVSDYIVHAGPNVFINECSPYAMKLISETKLRRRATPFGFGLTMGGLNNTQKAIVAALGLSRA